METATSCRPVPPSFAPPFVLLVSAGYIHSSSYSQSPYNWKCNRSPLVPPRPLPLSLFVFFVSVSFLAPFPFARCRYSRLAACRREMVVPLPCRQNGPAERAGGLKVGHFGFSKSWSCMTGNFLSPSSSRPRAPKRAKGM